MNAFKEIVLEEGAAPPARAPLDARLPAFYSIPEGTSERLGRLRVCIAGNGSIGQVIGMHFGRLQIKEIRLIDSGTIKPESLITHAAAFPEDLGLPKASTLGRRIKDLSPSTRVHVFDGPVQSLGLSAMASADVVLLASDNLLMEVDVGRYCRILGQPLVQASVLGEALLVQVRTLANAPDADGPCPLCGFTAMEQQALNDQTTYSCEAVLPGGETPRIAGPVTASCSFLCSMAGEFAVIQALRHVLGLGRQDQVADTMLEYCAVNHKVVLCPLKKNPRCPSEHAVYRRVPFHHAIPDCSVRQLLMAAGLATMASAAGTSVQLDGLVYCEKGRCGCPVSQPLKRFRHTGPHGNGGDPICGTCGKPVRPQQYFVHDPVPIDLLGERLDKPLRDLGVEHAGWAIIRDPDGSTLIGA